MTVLRLEQIESPRAFGAKAWALGRAIAAGLPVPAGYGVSVDSVATIHEGQWQSLVPLFDPVMELRPWAVRSSAVDEDGVAMSHAGQYASRLNISSLDTLRDAVAQIADSAETRRAAAYQQHFGLRTTQGMGVVIQRMVRADLSGVLFTVNPMTGGAERVIEAVWGLGEAAVSGRVAPDLYVVQVGGTVVEIRAGRKDWCVVPDPGGGTAIRRVAADLVHRPALARRQIEQLDRLASQCERIFGPALDIEWSFAADELYLLQWRPITT